MKVGFDVAQTCGERAGCAWHADSLARALARNLGPENLTLYHHFGKWVNSQTARGTLLSGVASPLFPLTRPQGLELWAAIESGDAPLPGEPDIVHSNSFMAPRLPRVPYVYTIHDLCFLTHPEFTTERNIKLCNEQLHRALKYAAAFHFISHSSYNDFENRFPGVLDEKNIRHKVIHSGPRLQPHSALKDRLPSKKAGDAPWLSVGTIEPRKNIDGLLDAYEFYLDKSEIRRPLLIAGNRGWHSETVHSRIQKLAAKGNLRYEGYISDDSLRSHYESSFAFLFPSHYEGFGLPVVEAMNFGLPTLSNKIPSVEEFTNDAALLTDFTNPQAAAHEMIRLETDLKKCDSLAQQSQTLAQTLSWDKTASEVVELYKTLLRDRSRVETP